MKRAEWQSRFAELPKGLTMAQVAQRLQKPYRLTARWVRLLGYESGDGRGWTEQRLRQFRRVPWEQVPWDLPNVAIARMFSVSREIVRRRRKEYERR